MIGTIKQCPHCPEKFGFKSNSSLIATIAGFYLYRQEFINHVRECRNLSRGLNEVGRHYLGLTSKETK